MAEFRFSVNKAHTRKYNEYFGDIRRAQYSALILAVLTGGVAAALWFFSSRPTWALVLILVLGFTSIGSLIMIGLVPARVGSPQRLYERYPLVPAIVVDVRKRGQTLLALVDASTDPDTPIAALCVRNTHNLVGHTVVPGQRIPAVAVSGNTTLGKHRTYDLITPVPLAWSTADPTVLTAAEAAIDPADWERLASLRKRWKEVAAQSNNILVDI